MEQGDDLVAVLRAAAKVGSGDDRGVLEWRQLLERAATEIERLRADLAVARAAPLAPDSGEQSDVIDIVDVRAR